MGAFPIFENFTPDIIEYGMGAYSSLEPWTYPFIILGIIGYLYAATHSLAVTVVGILVTFGLLGAITDFFRDIPQITEFLYIIAIIGIAMLLTAVVIHRRR